MRKMMSDAPEIEWPREIWMAEREEHDQGVVTAVLSEHATVARFAGDTERDREFHHYIDAGIYEGAVRYWKAQIASERQARENADRCLREKDAAMTELFRLLDEQDRCLREKARAISAAMTLLDEHGINYSHLIS